MAIEWKDIKHFAAQDFKDHYGVNKGEDMNMEVVGRLDSLRDWIKCPIQVTAGYDSKGHSEMSYHYRGLAVDIIICSLMRLREQWTYIRTAGFEGIGIYPNWKYKIYSGGFHLDLRDIPQLWRRAEDGSYKYFLP